MSNDIPQSDNDPAASYFVGRDSELTSLHLLLKEPGPFLVFLEGLWGSGKSSFCEAYARIFRGAYAGIVKIPAWQISTSTNFEQEVRSEIVLQITGKQRVATELELNDLLRQETAISSGKPFLFVVDDIDRIPNEVLVRLIPVIKELAERHRVIIAVSPQLLDRLRLLLNPMGNYRCLTLGPLSPSESELLMRNTFFGAGKNESVAQGFLGRLKTLRADWSALSPRFLLELLNRYQSTGQIDTALLESIGSYFNSVTNLVIANTPNGLKVLPIGHLEPSGFITPDSGIIRAVPFVVIQNFGRFWRVILDEFDQLINDPATTESKIQQFFERHPQFLKGIDYEQVIAHPVLERDDDGDLIPDFFLKPRDSQFVDIIDLKLPKEKVLVGRKDRKKLSGAVGEAIAQLREYRDYFERKDYRERVAQKYGVKGYRPNTIVVIGRAPTNLPEEKVRQVLSEAPSHLKIMTYDTIASRMKAMAEQHIV